MLISFKFYKNVLKKTPFVVFRRDTHTTNITSSRPEWLFKYFYYYHYYFTLGAELSYAAGSRRESE